MAFEVSPLFRYDRYRPALRAVLDARQAKEPARNGAWLARKLKVHRSYVSAVFRELSHLTQDQLFVACEALGLSPREQRYLSLVQELERSRVPHRREHLKARVARLRHELLRPSAVLPSARPSHPADPELRYYASPTCSAVHLYLTMEAFRQNPSLLQKRLRISEKTLAEALATLEERGIIARAGERIELKQPPRLLDTRGPLPKIHATQFRLKGLAALEAGQMEDGSFFTGSFVGNEAAFQEVRALFLEFLTRAAAVAEASPAERPFHLNFDLFWL